MKPSKTVTAIASYMEQLLRDYGNMATLGPQSNVGPNLKAYKPAIGKSRMVKHQKLAPSLKKWMLWSVPVLLSNLVMTRKKKQLLATFRKPVKLKLRSKPRTQKKIQMMKMTLRYPQGLLQPVLQSYSRAPVVRFFIFTFGERVPVTKIDLELTAWPRMALNS